MKSKQKKSFLSNKFFSSFTGSTSISEHLTFNRYVKESKEKLKKVQCESVDFWTQYEKERIEIELKYKP